MTRVTARSALPLTIAGLAFGLILFAAMIPNQRSKNPKCFIWCRFGTQERYFFPLNCPYVVRRLHPRDLT